jgi:hypothetical protein
VRNGGERILSDEAVELLRVYELLDVKRRMKLLDFAFKLEEERLNQKKEGDWHDHDTNDRKRDTLPQNHRVAG